MKWKKFSMFLTLAVLISPRAFSQLKQPPLEATIDGHNLVFTTIQDPDVKNEVWHTIVVTDDRMNSGKARSASDHPFANDEKNPCRMLRYLRVWLTEADNGVNGKKTKDKMPLKGAEAQAMSVYEISTNHLNAMCPENKQVCEVANSKRSVCSDLENLINLSRGINQEAAKQSETGLRGHRFY